MKAIVVDDEPWMLKRFAAECEEIADVQLLRAFQNPLDVWKFVRENVVDLAFLDVIMPEMNGFELANKIRGLSPEIRVIFVTAHEEDMAEALRRKIADAYVLKPYDAADVQAAMARALQRK